MRKNLLTKVWDAHRVATLPTGQDQLFIAVHLIHEVTSPQAFAMLRERKLPVLYPERTFATVDHIVPTLSQHRPFDDSLAELMMVALEKNCKEFGVKLFGLDTQQQGIVHIIGPELGITQPGMTIACGDSHTSTHGAFGAIACGIGTSQIRDVLASQTLAMEKPKVRRIVFEGRRQSGIYAKDLILRVMQKLGVHGGIGYAYEYAGAAIASLSMEERMTICNMSIEGGARFGYVNPDQTTIDYLRGRPFVPQGAAFDRAARHWLSLASDDGASYDDEITIDISALSPMITWGINPGQAVAIDEPLPTIASLDPQARTVAERAYAHMGFKEGSTLEGQKIDVAFIGSCTNGRLSDLQEVADFVKGKKVAPSVKALIVPGSKQVRAAAEALGLDTIFIEAGFQWRDAGCSMCLAMNPDKLQGRELCASSSNRNFIGRQGSPTGRTILMSPVMVAAAAITGALTNIQTLTL